MVRGAPLQLVIRLPAHACKAMQAPCPRLPARSTLPVPRQQLSMPLPSLSTPALRSTLLCSHEHSSLFVRAVTAPACMQQAHV
eukprot:123248-Chlamydomonas_euryale.AAC.1